jgi:tetratricopeptide (TPR) repeat protein
LPATVQALLAARIDRQAESEKVVLQAAAVIGRSFRETLLREVTGLSEHELGKRLASLQSAQLMTGSQAAMERELSFKHALTQQVAYRSLLTPQRATLHARVAGALQAQFSDSLDEHAALISHHWERAGDKLKAAGWGARAAGWAGFTNPLEADRHWRRVIALTDSPPPSPEAMRLALTARVMLLTFAWRQGVPEGHSPGEFERQVDRLCEEGQELARAAGDPSVETLLVALRAGFRCFSGRLEEGREQGLATIEMARSIGDVGLELALCPLPLWAAATLGRWHEVDALAKHERALCQDDPTLGGGPVLTCPGAWIRVVHGLYRVYAGRPGEAQHDLRDAIRLGREHNDVEAPAWAQLWLVHAAYFLGMDPEVVLELAREAMGMADRTATAYSRGWAHCAWGLALIHAREWAAAQDALRECLSIWGPRKIGTISEPLALAYLSRAELGQGNVDDAVAIAQDAIAKAMAIGARPYEIDGQLSLAHALLAQHQPSEAIDAALSRAEALVSSTGSITLQPQVLLVRASLAVLQGDRQGCEQALQAANTLRLEMGATNLERRL